MPESPAKNEKQQNDTQQFYNYSENHIEEKVNDLKRQKVSKVSLNIIIKPALFSFVVLIFSFFLDISSVPILGNITSEIAQTLFPQWQPINREIQPLTFWWLPAWTYAVFILMSLRAFSKLREEVLTSNSRENIDRIISASVSVVDALSTALPLIGAAILLVSIKLGPEIFLGFSVPFEIKALIVLAIGKLFEPVLDTLSIKFQKIVDQAIDIKETYYAKAQVELTKQLLDRVAPNGGAAPTQSLKSSMDDLENYKKVLSEISEIGKLTYRNFGATYQVLERITKLMDANGNLFGQFNDMSKSVGEMAEKMNNDHVSESLNSLKTIVDKTK